MSNQVLYLTSQQLLTTLTLRWWHATAVTCTYSKDTLSLTQLLIQVASYSIIVKLYRKHLWDWAISIVFRTLMAPRLTILTAKVSFQCQYQHIIIVFKAGIFITLSEDFHMVTYRCALEACSRRLSLTSIRYKMLWRRWIRLRWSLTWKRRLP